MRSDIKGEPLVRNAFGETADHVITFEDLHLVAACDQAPGGAEAGKSRA
jgi:hypothetical protein